MATKAPARVQASAPADAKSTSAVFTAAPPAKKTSTATTAVAPAPAPPPAKKRKRSWEESYQALVQFKDKMGHCQVPVHNYTPDTRLGGWVNQQRARRLKLSQEQRDQLDGIGFQWTVKARNKQWKEMVDLLTAYIKRYGHCHYYAAAWTNNSSASSQKYAKLANFCKDQRLAYSNQKISAARRQDLEGLGFCWDAVAAQKKAWHFYYQQLVDFYDTYGHILVPLTVTERSRPRRNVLGYWLVQQRRIYKQASSRNKSSDGTNSTSTTGTTGGLTPEQAQLLNRLDVDWADAVSDDEDDDDEEDSDSDKDSGTSSDDDSTAVSTSSDSTVSEDESDKEKQGKKLPKKISLPNKFKTISVPNKLLQKKRKRASPTLRDFKREANTKDKAALVLAPLAFKLCQLLALEEKNVEASAHQKAHVTSYEQRIEDMIRKTEVRIGERARSSNTDETPRVKLEP